MKHRLRTFALSAAVILGAVTASAQQTTQSTTGQQPVDRSGAAPAQDEGRDRTFLDAARDWAKETRILERIEGDIDGWYPRLTGMTRGSGFSLGPGYRTHLFGTDVLLDVSGALSTKWYKAADVHARWYNVGDGRLAFWTDARLEDFPEEDFFGIGPDSSLDTRTNYAFRSSDVGARIEGKFLPWLHTNATVGIMRPSVGRGHDADSVSIDQVFTDVAAPGLAEQPTFIHAGVALEADYRDVPGNPRRGGFYHASFSTWDDRSIGRYDFRRFDANVSQFVPVTADRRHIVSGRIGASFLNNAAGGRVPFYFLPYVGGADTIRSYREFRFKEENALWFGGEYRWMAMRWMSTVAFADFGNVSHDWQQVARDLKQGYGVGLRVHSDKQTLMRLDVATGGGEGWRAFLKLGLM